MGLRGLISPMGLMGLIRLIGPISLIGPIGLIRLIGPISPIGLMGLISLIGPISPIGPRGLLVFRKMTTSFCLAARRICRCHTACRTILRGVWADTPRSVAFSSTLTFNFQFSTFNSNLCSVCRHSMPTQHFLNKVPQNAPL